MVLPISEKYLEQAKNILNTLKGEGFRVETDFSNNTIQSKVRHFESEKIPYSLIIGEKEIKTNSVSVRGRDGKELGLIRIDEFISKILSEINQKP
jgi:threonyl-tRNA synthetase